MDNYGVEAMSTHQDPAHVAIMGDTSNLTEAIHRALPSFLEWHMLSQVRLWCSSTGLEEPLPGMFRMSERPRITDGRFGHEP